jgi:signal transduction histidine kinase
MSNCAPTAFAPSERAALHLVERLSRRFAEEGFFARLMDCLPDVVLVLNPQRQIVYANRAALELAGVADLDAAIGQRPGELLRCKNLHAAGGGCGTGAFCRYCGAVKAVLASQSGEPSVEDCRLTVERDGREQALDLRIWATPLDFHGEPLTCVALADIGEEKRRLFLERVFLHDLSNTAMAVRGFCELLNDPATQPPARQQYMETLGQLAERMADEVQGHQLLVAAENNQLRPDRKRLDSLELLRQLFRCYNRPETLGQRYLEVAPESASVEFWSDETLMVRVLANMIKNAIEASPEGATVALGCRREPGRVAFWTHNYGSMPEAVRAQVFQRSFSTRGTGRGLGTYSMKFFTERYLGGKISFTSTEAEGTTFTVSYPVVLP